MHKHIILSLLALLLISCSATPTPLRLPTLTPASTPANLRIVFDVVDEVTGQPVNGEITIRRECQPPGYTDLVDVGKLIRLASAR